MPKLLLIISLWMSFLCCGTALADRSVADIVVTPESDRLPAPGFTSDRLGGGKARLSDYQGKVILLNFWATWCMPCRMEMPSMESLRRKYKAQDFVVIAISTDDSGSEGRIASFVKRLNLGFPVLLDPQGEVSAIYKVSSLPASYLIDRNGKIAGRVVGSVDWASSDAFKIVESLLSR